MRLIAGVLALAFVVARYGPDAAEVMHLHDVELPQHEEHTGSAHHHGDADDHHDDEDSDCQHHGHCCCTHTPALAFGEDSAAPDGRTVSRNRMHGERERARAELDVIPHVPIA